MFATLAGGEEDGLSLEGVEEPIPRFDTTRKPSPIVVWRWSSVTFLGGRPTGRVEKRLFEEAIEEGARAGMRGGPVFKLAFVEDELFDVMETESERTSIE